METIHFKTVDPVSQALLRRASQLGQGLNWERYEKQQPQDGFLRLGLSCPYGCLQGPCRIDPFGRGAALGICGLDRDGMAAAFLLRLTLQGVLECLPADATGSGAQTVLPWPLREKATASAGKLGETDLSPSLIPESALLLARPSATPERLVRQAIRLSLFGTGLSPRATGSPAAGSVPCSVGYGHLAGDAVVVGVTGGVPTALLEAFLEEQAATGAKPEIRLVALGDWIATSGCFLPIACSSGEAEALLASGRVNLVVAGPQTDPGLLALCAGMKIPVAGSGTVPNIPDLLKQARAAAERRNPAPCDFDPALVGDGRVTLGESEIATALTGGSPSKIALLGGSDSLFQSLGHLPVEMAKALHAQEYAVASWGDAACWMMKQDLPVTVLDARQGPLAAIAALAAADRLTQLKGVCFCGLRHCSDWTLALGLSALGIKVSLATPVPLWGSERVRGLLKAQLAELGGVLTHYDHPVRADELLDWFLRS